MRVICSFLSCVGFVLTFDNFLAQSASFADAKLVWTLPWDADWVTAVQFVGSNKIAAGNKLGDILVWNLPDTLDAKVPPPPARHLVGHTNEITRMLVTPDQKTLISASNDRTIKYWDMQRKNRCRRHGRSERAGTPGCRDAQKRKPRRPLR